MPPSAKDSNGGTLTRRVSFSNRISYSDDASATTVTTDDELYQDDGSFLSDSDEERSIADEDSVESETEACEDESIATTTAEEEDDLVEDADDKEEEVSEKGEDSEMAEPEDPTMTKDEIETADDVSWDPLEDEPPLVIRDMGVPHRPSDFLGGYGPETATSSRYRVKLRKSWVAGSKDKAEEAANPIPVTYSQFDEWKKSRVASTPTFRRKQQQAEAKQAPPRTEKENQEPASTPQEKKNPGTATAKDTKNDDNPPTKTTTSSKMKETSIKAKNPALEGNKGEQKVKKDEVGNDENTSATAVKSAKKAKKAPKSALKKPRSASTAEPTNSKPTPTKKKPLKKDPETEAREKEIAQLKEHATKLQRKLDVIEVRTISQLADMEEETTKRMREYRLKADDLARKKRAKEEKQALKEKAMKSQDLIEHLRRSNQKLRSEGIKMKKAVEELKETNQQLQEQRSLYGDYAAQVRSFEEVEVKLAEEMNNTLHKELPKYEKLMRNMEEGVTERAKSGQSERKAKEMYLGAMQSMLYMLEEYCTDDNLVDSVTRMMDEESSDEDTKMDASSQDDQSTSTVELETVKPVRRKSSLKTANKKKVAAPPPSPKKSSKRPTGILKKSSVVVDEEEDSSANPTKKAVRRSSSTGGKVASRRGSAQPQPRAKPRRSSSSSFRSTRTPMKAATKLVSDDDESITCSVTSIQSDQYSVSDQYSLSEYV